MTDLAEPLTTVWILTSEYNDYDQYGEYFEEVWLHKPSIEELMEKTHCSKEECHHIRNGGGRIGWEHCWYHLREYLR